MPVFVRRVSDGMPVLCVKRSRNKRERVALNQRHFACSHVPVTFQEIQNAAVRLGRGVLLLVLSRKNDSFTYGSGLRFTSQDASLFFSMQKYTPLDSNQ